MKQLNVYLANLAVGNIKLHNLHWNVQGRAFKNVHEYLEGIYDGINDTFDEVAEVIRMRGERPAASMKEYLEIADVKELESKAYPVEEALKITLEYLQHMRDLAVSIRKAADEKDDFVVVGMMEDQIGQYNKNIWFIESTLA